MKHFLLSISFVLLCAGRASAVPARPGVLTVRQPDGTSLTIELRGDEHCHMAYSEDGYPLMVNGRTGYYEYATIAEGALRASGRRAADVSRRSAADRLFLQTVDRAAIPNYIKAAADNDSTSVLTRLRISDVPTTGSPRALVVLVEFRDTKFSSYVGDAKAFYQDLMNQPDYTNEFGATGSAYDFYKASSDGSYTPQFDVYGPVTVSQTESYYAGTSGQANVAVLVYEVAKKLDSEIDFSQYDTDGDGQVDNMYIFYAGKGQADTGTSGLIWPHNAWVSLSGYDIVRDGVTIDRYACSSELNGKTGYPLGIGTFVHEFGHVLGIPDLYDTDSQFTSGYTLGYWDTMCKGCYNNEQNTPPLYSAYERYALGWLSPTTLSTDGEKQTLAPLSDENRALIVPVSGQDNEYFLLENRQQKGWDEYLPGHGLLVWHIDENQEAWKTNTPNNGMSNPAGHKCVDIVEADGKSNADTEAGDAFPGTGNVTSGAFQSWAGRQVFALSAIVEEGENVSFTASSQSTGINGLAQASGAETLGAVYSLGGQRLGTSLDGLAKGLYVCQGRKVVMR